jgi:peptide/nickel transport system substrate-binding protein
MMAEHFDALGHATSNGDRPKRGGIMKGTMQEPIPHYDLTQGFGAGIAMLEPVYNALLMRDPYDWQAPLLPDLAHSWETSSDGMKITFNLHEGVKWHDGVDFTAADAKWALERVLFLGLVGGNLDNEGANFWQAGMWTLTYDSFEAADRNTLVVNLVAPRPWAIPSLGSGFAGINGAKHIGGTDPVNAFRDNLRPVGTGPMRIVDEITTTIAVFERNPDYFKPGLPFTDGYEVHVIEDIQTRATAVRTERVFWNNPVAQPFVGFELARSIAESDPGIVWEPMRGFIPFMQFMNGGKPPLDDIRIRQAISEGIDRKNLLSLDVFTGETGLGHQRGMYGSATPPFSEFAPPREVQETFIGYGPDMEVRRQHARDLIADYEAENGPIDWSGIGFGCDGCATQHASSEVHQLIQPMMEAIGIDYTIDVNEIFVQFGKFLEGGTWIFNVFIPTPSDDPSPFFKQLYTNDALFGGSAWGGKPQVIDELFERQMNTVDPEERKRIVWEIDRKIQEDANLLTIYHPVAEHIRRDYVRGWSFSPKYFDALTGYEFLWLDFDGLPFADET